MQVVPALDPVEHGRPRFDLGFEPPAIQQLPLQRRTPALRKFDQSLEYPMIATPADSARDGSGASRDSGRLSPIWCRNVADTPDAKTLHFHSFNDEAKTED